ncbi:polynucleotide kinase 3'-phosphatase [Seminavis robusta]|uniref:Polynucleotide kinase 3'-phosphatase n=1 Tax=Seminavis robusta TaxID=568900 RepID=A0A9N8I112_9STRA|nr:polynucleotide kinase 3'-phosphatase [Seminavis robusta]|eukprot:Sro3028_g342420.1 polynucleotide kinase 3'-phosphatase (209) ;mRNA; r:3096-3722
MADDDGWETVPQKTDKKRQAKANKAMGVLPWISHIPPTDQNSDFAPSVLLLCGIPGSGKSTFASSLQTAMPYKFVRINQDELGNRLKCEELARTALTNRQVAVIDRCNFDPKQRSSFVNIAAEFGVPVDCVVLSLDSLVTVDDCIRRCQQRRNHPGLSAQDAKGVVLQMAKQMSPPPKNNNTEGIRKVVHITDVNMFNDTLVTFMNQK